MGIRFHRNNLKCGEKCFQFFLRFILFYLFFYFLQIAENDRLPKCLCYRCMYNLENFYDFRTACVNAVALLEKNLPPKEEVKVVNKINYFSLSRKFCLIILVIVGNFTEDVRGRRYLPLSQDKSRADREREYANTDTRGSCGKSKRSPGHAAQIEFRRRSGPRDRRDSRAQH